MRNLVRRVPLALLLTLALLGVAFARGDVKVHITDSGTKYHRAGCRFLKGSDSVITLQEAKERGLEPCKVCKPPK